MQKVYGSPVRQDGLYKIGRNKWELIYGFGKDHETDETGWNYRETFNRRLSLDEIKEIIIAQINADIDNKILSGFSWRDMPVWLSSENQFNYKAAFDLAMMTQGATLPVKFKFGTDAEPQYFEFDNLDDFRDFYTSSIGYVSQILNEGWAIKDGIDWSDYE